MTNIFTKPFDSYPKPVYAGAQCAPLRREGNRKRVVAGMFLLTDTTRVSFKQAHLSVRLSFYYI